MTTTSPPHPSSTLVNISDDADPRLIRVLAPSTPNPSSFESACASAISNGDAAGLLRTVISNGAIAGLLQSGYTIDEAVSAFSLLTVYLNRVGDAKVERELCGALAEAVDKAGQQKNGGVVREEEEEGMMREKQSAMVAALFNLRSNGNEKVKLLTKIVELADVSALSPGEARGVCALADMLDASTLKASLVLWGGDGIDSDELRALYEAVAKGMDRVLARLAKGEEDKATVMKSNAAKERKQTYMLLFLETYKDASKLDAKATSYAREASIYAIREPINLFSTQRRILTLPAVSALQKSQPALYDLLKIFMEGKLQDYRDFTAMPDKMTVFATFKINEDQCMKNMCLLSLVSLAGEHEEIPYSAIASTLNVPEDNVEQWVIRAVSSGLMEAKMDQLRKVVLVERCAVRQFGKKEWGALKVRLDTWKANVKGVLDALEKSGAVAPEDGQ
eukprot:CAMPEP_0201884726 /NCGR_PEP_ID=MMETSP0902-20130614/17520_1 /ASSEMBLY_ACC=CAM_ASM_000551 /TAXON_ID=420261 /ORGANISM="Thalassiosira antarctica, Strain CCMP982" /LENGTH=448 /DNA_ID=CAMNT_0048413733 /DNA_START=139 /DNA_END=1485 /DNA_ORIENTATION=+